jgi:hypothetical protein
MASEEKLMELLRRAHTVIGEGLIENALDESAEGLHNEIGELFGLKPAKRDTVRCGATGSSLAVATSGSAGRTRPTSAPYAATHGATSTTTSASRSATGRSSARSASLAYEQFEQ